MILSRRERYIAIVAGAAVALLVLDHYAVTPLLERYSAAQAERQELAARLVQAQQTFDQRGRLNSRWNQMRETGLSSDPVEAESLLLHALNDWANETRLTLTSRKFEREKPGKYVGEIRFQVVGVGNMESVSRFLHMAEASPLPLRIKEMQIGMRREGADDLSLNLSMSTIYVIDEPEDGSGGNA